MALLSLLSSIATTSIEGLEEAKEEAGVGEEGEAYFLICIWPLSILFEIDGVVPFCKYFCHRNELVIRYRWSQRPSFLLLGLRRRREGIHVGLLVVLIR